MSTLSPKELLAQETEGSVTKSPVTPKSSFFSRFTSGRFSAAETPSRPTEDSRQSDILVEKDSSDESGGDNGDDDDSDHGQNKDSESDDEDEDNGRPDTVNTPEPVDIRRMSSINIDISVDIPENVTKRVASENEIEGKQGWLYREVTETKGAAVVNGKDNFVKIWVCLYDGYLLFSDHRKSNSNTELFNHTVCSGFIKITPSTEVYLRFTTDSLSTGSPMKNGKSNAQKYTFQVKDSNEVLSVQFYCEFENERDEWISLIKEAIKIEKTMYLENKTLILPSVKHFSAVATAYHYNNTVVTPSSAIDYPRKAGFLKKTSTGKSTFGIRTTKNRHFRLENGEFRYFEDDKASSVHLKEVVSLVNATIAPITGKADTSCITLILNNGTRTMKLEAPSAKIALEWRDAFAETIYLTQYAATLASNGSGGPVSSPNNKRASFSGRKGIAAVCCLVLCYTWCSAKTTFEHVKRRYNIHDQVSQDERDRAMAVYNRVSRKSGRADSSAQSPMTPNNRESVSKTKSVGSMVASPGSATTSPQRPSPARTTSLLNMGRGGNVNIPHTISEKDYGDDDSSYNPIKSNACIDLLKAAISGHFLCKSFLDILPVVDAMREKSLIPGEVILWHGATGDRLYVLESGQLEVLKDGEHICYMYPGKSFGDLALLHNVARQMTIRACGFCKLWYISREQFRTIALREEGKQNTEKINFLKQIELFEKLTDGSLETIAEVMMLKTYHTGDKIIKQGDVGDCFYMILSGRVTVTQSSLTGGTVELVKLGTGKHFGELALIDDAPRKATVTAITPVVQCWTLDRVNFLNLFGSMNDAVKESIGITMLKNVKILETLSHKQLQTVARCLVPMSFSEGEHIIKQGDIGDSFYLISTGEVAVQVNHIQVTTLTTGAFFGEMSLLSNERRSATCIANEDTTCLVLSRADFDNLLGPLEEIIKLESKRRTDEIANANRKKAESGLLINRLRTMSGGFFSNSGSPKVTRRGSVNKECNALFANTSAMFDLNQLDKLKKLGIGTFSTVYLVQHTTTSKLYAMKVIHKDLLYNFKQENAVYNERDTILSLVDCQSVTPLFATLQDHKSVYFILAYTPGQDLFTALYQSNKLPVTKLGGIAVKDVLFYGAIILRALSYMHDLDIVYRDLKPENMVLDATGYLQLTDFGTAKKLVTGQKSNTLCGTPEYIAPEILLSQGHNKAVDFWSFGVLIYELLTRTTPFAHSNVAMIYQKIIESGDSLSVNIANNSNFDPNSRALLMALMQRNPNMRLGMLRNGIEDVWAHNFFKTVTPEMVDKRELRPAFIPEIEDAEEISHLDAIELLEDDDEIPPYIGQYDFSSF